MSFPLLLGLCVASLALGLAGTAMVRRAALRAGMVDVPDARRVHKRPVPRLGGVAIAACILAAALAWWCGLGGQAPAGPMPGLLIGAAVVFATGLVDDVRPLRPVVKLAAHFLAAGAAVALGVRLESFGLAGIATTSLGWLACPLSLLWLVGLTNAVNFIDGVDALAGSLGCVAGAAGLAFAVAANDAATAVLMCGLLGGLGGFLCFNVPPARIFMGDCGATLVGFVLAAASVLCANRMGSSAPLWACALALGVPILDMLFVVIRRLLQSRPPMAADLGHIHHRLLAKGMGHSQVTLTIAVPSLLAGLAGVALMGTAGRASLALLACGLLALLTAFSPAASFCFVQFLRVLKRVVQAVAQERRVRAALATSVPHVHSARTFEHWWSGMCAAAACMNLASLSLQLARGGNARILRSWQAPGWRDDARAIKLAIPVKPLQQHPSQHGATVSGGGAFPVLHLLITVPAGETPESVGQHTIVLGRLLDGYGPQEMPSALAA